MPQSSVVALGERVRKMLEEKSWSQAKLADEADFAPPALSKILSGERSPGMEHVLSLARALGLTPLELVHGTSAEAVLDQWVPRAELDGEARTRQSLRSRVESDLQLIKKRPHLVRAFFKAPSVAYV